MNKEELLELYREFGDDAQKALDFVVKNSPVLMISDQVPATDEGGKIIFKPEVAEKPKGGIYIIFRDGQYKLFEKDAAINKDDVKYIGVIYDGHSFAIALKDLGEFQLVKDGVKCPSNHPLYRDAECEALIDWECIEHTKHIQELGTDIELPDGEYIPSLPMLVVMRAWAEKINEALEFVGGELFDMGSSYWSCTEYGSTGAWYVSFHSGYVLTTGKYYSYVVRPVAAFNL